jgi:acetolactate synthase-1/2/3 large subunit
LVQQWVARQPNSFLTSSGLASMGTGLPFAMAAKLTWPARPVASLIGDGGLLMYAGELVTLARLPGPLVVIVLNDGALSSIRVKQARLGYAPVGTLLPGADVQLAAMARDLGLQGVRVASRSALRNVLGEAMAADHPVLVEVMVDPAGYEYSQ